MSEVGVANEFGVSRAPAREALQRLEDMNLLQKTYKGRQVKAFNRSELRETYELKNVVEALGVMQGSLRATHRDHKEIAALLNKMSGRSKYGNIEKLQKINYQFHDRLVFSSRNRKVIDMYNLLAKQVRWAISLSLQLIDRPDLAYGEHKEIFDSFVRREAIEVRALMESHTNRAMERVFVKLRDKSGQNQ